MRFSRQRFYLIFMPATRRLFVFRRLRQLLLMMPCERLRYYFAACR